MARDEFQIYNNDEKFADEAIPTNHMDELVILGRVNDA